MSYRPDESVLISWLYGELDEAEKAKVDRYFQENPEELKKMRQFGDVKDIIGTVRDKEVIAPPIIMEDEGAKVIPIWKTGSFRTIATLAASLLLIMIVGKVLNLQVSYGDSELRIAFGPRPAPVNSSLTALEVQQMIDNSIDKNLDDAIRANIASNTTEIKDLVRQASNASQADIRNFAATLQRENLAQMRDYLQLSSADQRKYTDELIVDFSKFLQEQRSQDLNMFQTRFSKLEQNTDELKTETEQILASIISNSPQVQQSSY
ncbi:MAG TPA: hypothetical protein VFE50_03975 [Cyclobacteriaceae bacterium]|nr:hypothetical protein [Cyclobacteriaceae bacterium]